MAETSDANFRYSPNILITGTPGTGKSTLCQRIANSSGLEWIDVGAIARKEHFYVSYDATFDCQVLDEDRLLDALEGQMNEGGKIVDYHGCDFFPKRWFDAVFVLRCDNTVLYDRLIARGYTGKKLENNLQCEIFQTILDEARESYDAKTVFDIKSNSAEQRDANCQRITNWIQNFQANAAAVAAAVMEEVENSSSEEN